MCPVDRRSLLRGGGLLAAAALSGCQRLRGGRPRDAGDPLDGPHRIRLGDVEEDPASHLPIELSYELHDPIVERDDPAEFSFTVRNTGEEPFSITSDPPWPFGVVFLIREDAEEFERVTFWTDAYAESDHLRTRGRSVRSWDETHVEESLEGGRSVTETYRLFYDSPYLAAGRYRMWRSPTARRGGVTDSHRIDFDDVAIEPVPDDGG